MPKRHHKPAHKDETKKAKKTAAPEDIPHEESHSESAEESYDEDTHFAGSGHSEKNEKIRLEFYGSDLIRAQAPEVMKIADSIAQDWVHGGDFDKIPVGNPIAQAVVGKGLRKAKEVEKKLEEKGVFLMARMGADYLKSKIKR